MTGYPGYRRPLMSSALVAAMGILGGMAPSIAGSARRQQTDGAFGGSRSRAGRVKRLVRATGPGSINAESEMRQLVMAGKADEAAAYWEACHRVHYRGHGGPKMRWGRQWYEFYKAGDVRARGMA